MLFELWILKSTCTSLEWNDPIYDIFSSVHHRQPKLTTRITCGTMLGNVKMAVNLKDLYGNPGYRFKKISNTALSQSTN